MYEKQIQQGIAYLNEQRPGWVQRLDLDLLEMENGECCVLGQLGGDFLDALELFRLSEEESIQLGFLLDSSRYPTKQDLSKDYSILTEEWIATIKCLQN